jgi:hypothetical protein
MGFPTLSSDCPNIAKGGTRAQAVIEVYLGLVLLTVGLHSVLKLRCVHTSPERKITLVYKKYKYYAVLKSRKSSK